MRQILLLALLIFGLAAPIHAQEDEIVANLAGGRMIIHVARDAILFAAIDHPLEAKSVPPRVAELDHTHVGVFFGASEWQLPASPQPIRLDHDTPVIYAANPHYQQPADVEPDLEQLGVGYLEKLRPLVAHLHTKIDLKPDEPLLEIILLGYAPKNYGPEVWQIDFRVEQKQVGRDANYLETRVLRPRFTQLYPPEKGAPRTLVEIRFPENLPAIPLLGLLQQSDPRILKIRNSDPHFAKVVEFIERGQAQKANPQESADFLRAILPILAGDSIFIQATLSEDAGFQWVVPPSEPIQKTKTPEDKNRPPEAPTLRRRPDPQ